MGGMGRVQSVPLESGELLLGELELLCITNACISFGGDGDMIDLSWC